MKSIQQGWHSRFHSACSWLIHGAASPISLAQSHNHHLKPRNRVPSSCSNWLRLSHYTPTL
jgi:hypothetical protein